MPGVKIPVGLGGEGGKEGVLTGGKGQFGIVLSGEGAVVQEDFPLKPEVHGASPCRPPEKEAGRQYPPHYHFISPLQSYKRLKNPTPQRTRRHIHCSAVTMRVPHHPDTPATNTCVMPIRRKRVSYTDIQNEYKHIIM